MAGRSIHELEQLSLYTGRFHMGSIRDFGPSGDDGVWGVSAPDFRREIGQVVGLDYNALADVITLASITLGQEFALEFMVYLRDEGVGIADGKIFSSAGGQIELGFFAANTLRFACGANLDTPLTPPRIVHILATRDSSDDGFVFFDGVQVNTGAVGGNTETASTMNIGNLDALNKGADGLFYLARILDDYVDADEAARLYEHSRIQLWPGAPKRSGIWSPVV